MAEKINLKAPLRPGDVVEGIVISLEKDGIYLDLEGVFTGVIRGPELVDETGELKNLKKGDKIEATVVDPENEKGLIELSVRYASHKKAYKNFQKIFEAGKPIKVKVIDANKGGLIVKYKNFQGFLPVSQLLPQHYPKVEEGDKTKILSKLRIFIDQELLVKIISPEEEKIIFSEKQTRAEYKTKTKHKKGDVVSAKITGLADFGAFVTFNDGGEGLIHISELAWKRIERPEEVVKIGDVVKAKIVDFTKDQKAALSLKQLEEDPWEKANKKYKDGDIVKGKILRINPFGLFVSLDESIHGLAHISELNLKEGEKIEEKFKVGEEKNFKIISLEPEDHRLSLAPAE